jgi:hypothetical protein
VWNLASDRKERWYIEWISKRFREDYADVRGKKLQKDVQNFTVGSFITMGQQIQEHEDWGCGSIILWVITTALCGGQWSNARPEGVAARVRATITHKTRWWLDTETIWTLWRREISFVHAWNQTPIRRSSSMPPNWIIYPIQMTRAEFAALWDTSNVYKILVVRPGYKTQFGHTSNRRNGSF